MSILEKDITKKGQVNKLAKSEREFEAENNKEYKVKVIIDSLVYGKKANNQISSLYYFVL